LRSGRAKELLSRHPWTVALVATLACCGTILGLQFPFGFYAPDLSFHAAKILRAAEGEWFIDPFSGVPTIYPALFHTLLGFVVRTTGLNTFSLYQIGGPLSFLGLLGGFFFFARTALKNTEAAARATLAVSLVFYAPSAKYILLLYPANFSFVFVLLGLGLAHRYADDPRPGYLAGGLFLQGLAAAIWWFNAVISVCYMCALFLRPAARPPRARNVHFLFAGLAFLLPLIFPMAQWLVLREVLPGVSGPTPGRAFTPAAVLDWLLTLLTRGNMQYLERILPWNWSSLQTSVLPLGSVFLRYGAGFAAFTYFFALIAPFNLALLAFALRDLRRLIRMRWRGEGAHVLLLAALLVIAVTIPLMLVANLDHVRRTHFVAFAMLLLYAFARSRDADVVPAFRKLLRAAPWLGIAGLAYTVVYTTRLVPREPEPATHEVITFIRSLPDHRNQRLFLLDASVCRISPFVTFKSFVGHRHGVYFYQDIVSARRMYHDYVTIRDMRPGWRDVLAADSVAFLVFHTADSTEAELAGLYRRAGRVVWQNAAWVIIDPHPQREKTAPAAPAVAGKEAAN